MFHRTPDTATAPPAHDDVAPAEELISLVELALSLDAPSVGGWDAYLSGRGYVVTLDDIGRPSITRGAARELISERRECEVRSREKAAEVERQAIEQDRLFRAALSPGVPAHVIGGMSPAEAMFAAELNSHSYLPRRASVAEDLLDNGGFTFHSLAQPEE
jgi:hypothetical protein